MIDGDLGQVCSTRGQMLNAVGIAFCAVGYLAVLAFQVYHYGW